MENQLMGIMEVICKSLKEAFELRRFLPFFLLYLIFSLISLLLLLPIISRAPSIFALPSSFEIKIYYLSLGGILLAFVSTILINIWFSGALVFEIKTKKSFEKCLKLSKEIYLQLFALSLIICILVMLTFFFREFSFILQCLIDWIFIFALPAVVIKKDSFDFALARSFNIVRKKVFSTLSFWALTRFIMFLIFILSLFFSALILFPIFREVKEFTSVFYGKQLRAQDISLISSSIIRNYHLLILTAFVYSLFFSIIYVFNLISKTYYFMEISKKIR